MTRCLAAKATLWIDQVNAVNETTRVQVGQTTYHVVITGQPRPGIVPLLMLHGFVGSSADYDAVVMTLAQNRQVIRIDLPGHGETIAPYELDYFTFDRCVDAIVGILDALDLRRIALAGYSMGGRVALHVALEVPTRLGALILESTSYGIVDPIERKKRQVDDQSLANWIEQHTIAEFVDRWEQHPLFASQTHLPSEAREHQKRDRLKRSTRGLAWALRGMGVGNQRPLRDDLKNIDVPTLLLAGQLDGKYVSIATEMSTLIDRAQLTVIPGVGHNVHLEAPAHYAQIVGNFVANVDAKENP